MEFSVKKFDLLEELNLTQGVVERKTTIPILSHLLCEATGNRLTHHRHRPRIERAHLLRSESKKEGAGTIPAKKLLEFVRLLPEGEIRFKLLENHWVQITSDRRTYKMVGMAKDNFPAVPAFPHPLVKIPAKILSSLIAKTAFAISMEESRYTLNGALLILKPDTIAMVATDGHRLALAEDDHTLRRALQRGPHAGPQESHDRDPAPGRRDAKKAKSNSPATTAIFSSRSASAC